MLASACGSQTLTFVAPIGCVFAGLQGILHFRSHVQSTAMACVTEVIDPRVFFLENLVPREHFVRSTNHQIESLNGCGQNYLRRSAAWKRLYCIRRVFILCINSTT
jgi:hypothetical protein